MHAAARPLGRHDDLGHLRTGVNTTFVGHSSEVEESKWSVDRRRSSSSTGKTHFRLAPSVLSAAGGKSYDEAWLRWMRNGGPSNSDESYNEESQTLQTGTQAKSSSFYNSSWLKWMSTTGHAGSSSQGKSLQKSAADAEKLAFESVPRQALFPIMSRLPASSGEQLDEEAANPTQAGGVGALDYIEHASGRSGTLEETDIPVKYTRARLPVLDDESYQLWRVLHSLQSVSDDYADGYGAAKEGSKNSRAVAPHPIADGMDESQCPAFASPESIAAKKSLALIQRLFNWNDLPALPKDVEYTWYGVAFRSKRKPGSESVNFYEADRLSHEEAVDCGGLLMYWYGLPNATTGHNLATCIWTSRDDARRASALPLHARAAAHSSKAYESFELSRYAVRKVKGETGLRVEEWIE